MVTDPWSAPEAPAGPGVSGASSRPKSSQARRRVGLALVAAVVLVVLATIVAAGFDRAGSAGSSPAAAVSAYVAAAQRGDQVAMLQLVAPSQRDQAHANRLLPEGAQSIRFDVLPTVNTAELSPTSPDEGYVTVAEHGCLRPIGICGRITGTADFFGRVLVVREQGRWWVTAQPLRLEPGTRSSDP